MEPVPLLLVLLLGLLGRVLAPPQPEPLPLPVRVVSRRIVSLGLGDGKPEVLMPPLELLSLVRMPA